MSAEEIDKYYDIDTTYITPPEEDFDSIWLLQPSASDSEIKERIKKVADASFPCHIRFARDSWNSPIGMCIGVSWKFKTITLYIEYPIGSGTLMMQSEFAKICLKTYGKSMSRTYKGPSAYPNAWKNLEFEDHEDHWTVCDFFMPLSIRTKPTMQNTNQWIQQHHPRHLQQTYFEACLINFEAEGIRFSQMPKPKPRDEHFQQCRERMLLVMQQRRPVKRASSEQQCEDEEPLLIPPHQQNRNKHLEEIKQEIRQEFRQEFDKFKTEMMSMLKIKRPKHT